MVAHVTREENFFPRMPVFIEYVYRRNVRTWLTLFFVTILKALKITE